MIVFAQKKCFDTCAVPLDRLGTLRLIKLAPAVPPATTLAPGAGVLTPEITTFSVDSDARSGQPNELPLLEPP